jgi:hypothetical protein
MASQSVADVEGPWGDPKFESGLIARLKEYWNKPIENVPNGMLATYLWQRIAVELVAKEARRRIGLGVDDDTEMYEGELAEALKKVGR